VQKPQSGRAQVLDDKERLAALAATGLDAVADPGLEPFTRLVARLIDVPVALVSLVDDARQFFPAAVGLPEPYASRRQTPLSHSFCQHVVTSGAPFTVTDATQHPLVCANLAVPDMGVIGYAGMPLVDGDGNTLGSLCAIDTVPRRWTEVELDTLRDVAAACSSEVQMRIAVARTETERQQAELARADAEEARRRAERVQRQVQEARDRAEEANSRLELLAQATRAMTSTLDADAALQRLARVIVPSLGDWCLIDVLDGDRIRRVAIEHHAHSDVDVGERLLALPKDACTAPGPAILAGTRRTSVLSPSDVSRLVGTAADPVTRELGSLVDRLGTGQMLMTALLDRNGAPLGMVTLVRDATRPWQPEERTLVDELVRRASIAAEHARLYLIQRRAAETLQSSLLTELPDAPGLQLCARYQPALEGVDVGGDWYDAFPLDDSATAIVIGDVMGHDLSAAARMGHLRNILRTLAHDRRARPAELLGRVDQVARGLRVNTLATCVVGILTPADRQAGTWRLQWSSAGHLPPLVVRADGGCELLEGVDDLMLGIEPAVVRHDMEALVAPGDTIVMVTDGLVETRSGSLDDGVAHLRRQAARAATADLDDLCDRLISSAVGAASHDDLAVIAVRVPA
jgi:serine phosphatase RsbU (regulator of sigma subunit)